MTGRNRISIEIKTVKIILSGKINGFDNEFIKERVRVMYA